MNSPTTSITNIPLPCRHIAPLTVARGPDMLSGTGKHRKGLSQALDIPLSQACNPCQMPYRLFPRPLLRLLSGFNLSAEFLSLGVGTGQCLPSTRLSSLELIEVYLSGHPAPSFIPRSILATVVSSQPILRAIFALDTPWAFIALHMGGRKSAFVQFSNSRDNHLLFQYLLPSPSRQ